MRYLFVFDCNSSFFESREVDNFREALIDFMKYIGEYSDLFEKACKNFDDSISEDLMCLFDKFSNYRIDNIYEIKNCLYRDGDTVK